MSTSLYWVPVKTPAGRKLPENLRRIIEKRHGYSCDVSLGKAAINWLEGLSDAGIDGAQELIEALGTHDEIQLYFE